MIRRPPRSTLSSSSAASDVYKRQGTTRTTTTSNSNGRKSSASAFNSKDKENEFFNSSPTSLVSIRGMIDGDSKAVNMDKLRSMLGRYGSFPDRYRPLIWRFLLQLPEKRICEPQFGRLVGRGPHPAVKTLMKPYPLPETKLRTLMYNSLSALAWHSPVFSAVHFIPNMLFPFVKLYLSLIHI
eukprot:TRINITY_DN36624_c0_g1_i1.p1 TRINITY_DN36624_c0_g1~~TRINITY_DN36624_c0_g1_i1.p1  ORF type:complete len:183 (-),score=29.01 TRINITY_DN36624_c0_g1_i1:131-679(-)